MPKRLRPRVNNRTFVCDDADDFADAKCWMEMFNLDQASIFIYFRAQKQQQIPSGIARIQRLYAYCANESTHS